MKQRTIKGFKFIQEDMKSKNGNHTWELNKWYKHEEEIELCNKGFHACLTPLQSLEFVYGNKWFIIEARGKVLKGNDKFVSTEMRLIKELPLDKIIKRFALFCAKQSLVNYTKEYPNDNRISECIKITELYLDGKATLQKLNAAESAAWSARSAAESAARSARSAAESAAWSARSAAESAARSAESAAWSARSAAESAAWSARSAAESAAWSARSAAESAARSAAREEQNRYLLHLIKEHTK